MSRFNSGRACQLKTVPVSLHQDMQRQTSAQLQKSNLTHLWIPFIAATSTDGEILLRCTNTTRIVKFNTALRVPFCVLYKSQTSEQ